MSSSGKVTRPEGHSSSGGGEYIGWLIVAVAAVAALASSLVSVAAGLASLFGDGEWRWQWSPLLLLNLIRAGGPESMWPNRSPELFWSAAGGLLLLLLLIVFAGVWWWAGRHPHRSDPSRNLASPRDVAHLTGKAAVATAVRLRPTLSHKPHGEEVGPALGTLAPRGPLLRSSWEDVHLLVMAPRAGKTTAYAVPAVLDAPGAVLATSNKSDLFTDTAGLRAEVGKAWVFDPTGIAATRQAMTWDPLAAVFSVEDARRLASHFMQEVAAGTKDADFWSSAALGLLSSLLLAAAVSKHTLVDVWEWLNESADPTPAELLEDAGLRSTAAGLRGRQSGATETREGIYETARTAAQCLESDPIQAWVSPQISSPFPRFSAGDFVGSTDTLYLMSQETAGSAQPLVAALADEVMRAAVARAEAAGGRMDPPLTAVLDEAANVAKIRDLPKLYSHLGSRGVSVWTILQSYRQGQGVWGELGMDTLWSAATIKAIGAGVDDPKLAEDISRLAGEHEVTTLSRSHSSSGGSTSAATRRERIIEPAEVRALPKGRALLLATATRVAMIQTRPWYEEEHARRIERAASTEREALRERAAAR